MKCLILFISLFGISLQTMAACAPSGSAGTPIGVSFGRIPTELPIGSILASERRGNVYVRSYPRNDCNSELYVVNADNANPTGMTRIQGKPVYETGITGIGFQISDVTLGSPGNFIPAEIRSSELAKNHEYSGNIGNQVMIWLIKTGNIDGTKSASYRSPLRVRYQVGRGAVVNNITNTDGLLSAININLDSINFKSTTCEVSPVGGDTVRLKPVELKKLTDYAAGTSTGSQKNITLNITCPNEETGLSYTYWFNPITPNSTSQDGVLLNAAPNGATDVGFIIKKGSTPIIFSNPSVSDYKFTSQSNQSVTLNVDYYKLSNTPSTGEVQGIIEVILQEI